MDHKIRRTLRVLLRTTAVFAPGFALAQAIPAEAVPTQPATSPGAPAPLATQPDPKEDLIIVTGSAIPTTPDAVAVPVSIVDQKAIARGGISNNVLELIRKQIPAFAGRSNTGNSNANNTNQNTAGGSQAQLRNLDTLVLVNGRRVAVNAIAGLGGKVFVDLAQVPVGAIERVEVLTDGASAIYGSDAVGGVINLILKDHYEGIGVDGRVGFSAGGYREYSSNLTFGHALNDSIRFTVSASYTKSDPLLQSARSFTSPFYSTSGAVPGAVGANMLAPGLNSPADRNPTGVNATAANLGALIANGTYIATPTLISPQTNPPSAQGNIPIVGTGVGGAYDLSRFQYLLLGQEQKSLYASMSADILGKGLVFFADALVSENTSFTQFRPVTTGVTLPRGSPFNPITGALGGVTFGSTADPKRYDNRNESYRITAGIRGGFGLFGRSLNYEVAYVRSDNSLRQLQSNVIYAPNIARAIAGGFDANGNAAAGGAYSKVLSGFSLNGPLVLQPALDPLSRNPNRASLNNLFATEALHARSQLDSVDGKLTGNVLKLPGGHVGVAIGASYRRETLAGSPDPNGYVHADPNYCNDGGVLINNPSNYIGGQAADPFPVTCSSATPGSRTPNSRNIVAEYLELRVPVTSQDWHITGLYAFDIIGAVRHEKYSDAGNSTVPKVGFRWQPFDKQLTLRGTYSESFTAPPLYQEYGPTNNRLAGPNIVTAALGVTPGLTPVQDGVNPGLKPAQATSYSLGAVIKPNFIPRFTLDVEFASVIESGFPGGIGFSNIFLDVNQNGAKSIFAGNIAKGNFPGQPGATPFANPGDLKAFLQADPNNYNQVFAIDRFTNLGKIKVKTLNFDVSYNLPTSSYGTFSFNSNAAVFLNYQFQVLPTQKAYEYAGTATNAGTGVQGILPRFRSYSTINWNLNHVDLTVGNTYVSSVTDQGVGGITFDTNSTKTPPSNFPGRIRPYMSWDLRLAYTVADRDGRPSGFSIAAGVNNVFDTAPRVSTNVFTPSAAYTDNTADVSTYSPLGRLGYVSASLKF